ncbi:antitoxin VbhA family protein [Pleomorphomonas carboxyditropha]|uniref:antitoxin VbhA family protein n=1 Tax=Pleomorphomonas carboxyditropha TaxID=2023338 RepID=UPI001A9C2A53|nr:antitoxin VbhA family protein [Pleomorphomonas carboxyditropha]
MTTEEQIRRQDSVRYALASTRIEGLPITPDTEALLDAWARGEISDDELFGRALSDVVG